MGITNRFIAIASVLAGFVLVSESVYAAQLVEGFTNESRAGIVTTSGNSKMQTYDLGQKNSYEFHANKFASKGSYLRSTSKGIESARQWTLGLRYDRILAEKWSIFLAELVEGNTYAGFKQRYSTDVGGKYYFAKEEMNIWFAEVGYRHQRENRVNGSHRTASFSRIYSEYEHRFNPSVSGKFWIEYLQNFTVADDRFVNLEPSMIAALNSVFSVQFAYTVRYRQLPPPGVQYKTDTTMTAALIAKF